MIQIMQVWAVAYFSLDPPRDQCPDSAQVEIIVLCDVAQNDCR